MLAHMAESGVPPDQYTYGPLLEACRKGRKPKLARAFGKQMLSGRAYAISPFCLNSLRRSLGASQLRALCKECGARELPVVKKFLARGPPTQRGPPRSRRAAEADAYPFDGRRRESP